MRIRCTYRPRTIRVRTHVRRTRYGVKIVRLHVRSRPRR